ncbi:LicD family protein [Bacteroidota bacterium]
MNKKTSSLKCNELKLLHTKLIEMLDYIDNICEKNNIIYWLGSGSLLGSIRHSGFIPWDDDIDIEMLREDYVKFEKALMLEKDLDYVLQTNKTDKNYISPVIKFRNVNSFTQEIDNSDINYKYRGICIDIFCIENGNHITSRLSFYFQKILYILSKIKNDNFGILIFLKNITFIITNRIIIPSIRVVTKICKIKSYVLPLGYGATYIFYLKDILPVSRIKFEGKNYNGPNNPHVYLKTMYKDYMQLPSENRRLTHISSYSIYK